jgi:phage terminase large subunit-like protein
LFELIQGGNLVVYPNDAMRLAISRTIAVEKPRGWHISKEKQSHKIDVVVALAMACHAAVQGQTEPYFNTNYSEWMGGDGDWQALRAQLYLRSGCTFIL